ncbi:uncharacterized protein SAPINGB_P005731 [Magnusiomyces paraingens]|uniref:Ubiquinol-cytochrome c chaperone domain-containing protein n=1 Tax=Magnusiomyces paraingens TaxID=2606893 RepID=A0A5E8C0V3_9ASCO|nr:uncharacterized protein SAPINGB_P005731 [Saprochaete ingens]VVT57509.1 unnamed protein product [Saprochaete ingens]
MQRALFQTRLSARPLALKRGLFGKATEPSFRPGPSYVARPGSLKDQIVHSYQANKETPENVLEFQEQATRLPAWKKLLGQRVISTFHLDMDRIRSGPIAGTLYYELCKEQGYFPIDTKSGKKPTAKSGVPLSKTAKFYYGDLQLPQTFAQQFQITALHVWMLFVRMRAMPRTIGKEYQQKLVDTIFSDMEKRLSTELRIRSGSIIERYKKDFNLQLRGSVMSYDEGFFLDDATLASALWRNLFSGRPEIDESFLEQLVHYIRTQLYVLQNISDFDFSRGRFHFIDPSLRYTPLSEQDVKDIRDVAVQTRTDAQVILPSDKSSLSTEGW